MTTIINALKQLKSKGVAFAPPAVPHADHEAPKQISDSAPSGSGQNVQPSPEVLDGDATKPDRVSPSFILTVGHAARTSESTDNRLGGKPTSDRSSQADDSACVTDISSTAEDAIDTSQEYPFMTAPVSDMAWEVEPWTQIKVESWKLDDTASNDGSHEAGNSQQPSTAASSDNSADREDADLTRTSPNSRDNELPCNAETVEKSEGLSQTQTANALSETRDSEPAAAADDGEVMDEATAPDDSPAADHAALISDAAFDDEPEAWDQTPANDDPPKSHPTEFAADAVFDDEPEAWDQKPATDDPPKSHPRELAAEAVFDDKPEAWDQTPATDDPHESHPTELISEAVFDDGPEDSDQPPATDDPHESHPTELISEAGFDDGPEASDQPPATAHRLESHKTELISDVVFDGEPELLDQPSKSGPRPESGETELFSVARFHEKTAALEPTSIAEHQPESCRTELVTQPNLEDELEALDQTLAFEQIPETHETQSDPKPPDGAAGSDGISEPSETTVADDSHGVRLTDEARGSAVRPIETDSLWPETADVDWPQKPSSDVDAISPSPSALTVPVTASKNESAELEPETIESVREETVAGVPENDDVGFATLPRIRIEQLGGLDQEVDDGQADQPHFEPAIRHIDGSSGLDLSSDFTPASDFEHQADTTRDESSDEISAESEPADEISAESEPAYESEAAYESEPTTASDQTGDGTNGPSTVEASNDQFSAQMVDLPPVELGDDHPAVGGDDPTGQDQSTEESDPIGDDHPAVGGGDHPTVGGDDPTDQDQSTEQSDPIQSDSSAGHVNAKLGTYEQSVLEGLSNESLAKQYAQSLHRIAEAFPSGLPAVVLMVGVGPESDVSETLAHMAMMLVQHDAGQVLLVDANQSRRTLSERFAVDNQPGLSEVCRGETTWQDLLVPCTNSRLSILPAGTRSISPMTAASTVKRLIDEWKNTSQIVLIDAGDVDAPLTEALAGTCDSVYILIRLGRTKRDQALATVARLRSITGSLQGCIVTGIDAQPDDGNAVSR